MSDRENVTITVFNGEQHNGDWPTSDYSATLIGTIAWFQEKLEAIPEEYRQDARCEIDSVSGYEGCHCGHIEISYQRPETDEEMATRLVKYQAHRAATEVKERATLAALRAKYGSG